MRHKFSLFILSGVAFILFLSVPKFTLFYDTPEYIGNVVNKGFLAASVSGHIPIHPVFMSSLWLFVNLFEKLIKFPPGYLGNLFAATCGLVSILIFYKLSEFIINSNVLRLVSLFIFLFFPAIWIVNTNLLVESLILPLYLLSLYFVYLYLKKKNKVGAYLFSLSLALMLATHIESILVIPSIFGFWIVTEERLERDELFKLTLFTFYGIFVSLLIYLVAFVIENASLTTSFNNLFFAHRNALFDYKSFVGIARMVRNIFLNLFRGFGTLTLPLLFYVIYKNKKNKAFLVGFALVMVSIITTGAMWSGDFMPRRMVFLGAIASILIVKSLFSKSILYTAYLFPIFLANLMLYILPASKTPIIQIQKASAEIPQNQVYLQTHYLAPFMENYSGKVVWVDSVNSYKVQKELDAGKRVFIDSAGIKAPYFLFVGDNYHITSLSGIGKSNARIIFKNFDVCSIGTYGMGYGTVNLYEIFGKGENCFSNFPPIASGLKPGTPLVIYSNKFFDRVARPRIDYGDVATWVWYLMLNKQDPVDWSYADSNGNVYLPERLIKSNYAISF